MSVIVTALHDRHHVLDVEPRLVLVVATSYPPTIQTLKGDKDCQRQAGDAQAQHHQPHLAA